MSMNPIADDERIDLLSRVYHRGDDPCLKKSKLLPKLKHVATLAGLHPQGTCSKAVGDLLFKLAASRVHPALFPFLCQEIVSFQLDASSFRRAIDHFTAQNDSVSRLSLPLEHQPEWPQLCLAYRQACISDQAPLSDADIVALLDPLLHQSHHPSPAIFRKQLFAAIRSHPTLKFITFQRLEPLVNPTLLSFSSTVSSSTVSSSTVSSLTVSSSTVSSSTLKDDRSLSKAALQMTTAVVVNPDGAGEGKGQTEEAFHSSWTSRPQHIEFPSPACNHQLDPALLAQHLAATAGAVITRFPPEPNGWLHLGHGKAANLDHIYAQRHQGTFILRFDDTNPETAQAEAFDSILADLNWLGWTPHRITHTSDYFQPLFEHAQSLILRQLAYTCRCPPAQIKRQRRAQQSCPCRTQAPEASLAAFLQMAVRDAMPAESLCLRLRCDMASPNAAMRDPVAYRIKTAPHPRLGRAWAVYPTYDFSHAIVDSLENITHSFCTLEFSDRQELYVWLNRALGLYCPVQIEFARLEVSHTLTSKRRLKALITAGLVSGWDDPRLPTMAGLRRRGFPTAALHRLYNKIAINRHPSVMSMADLEAAARKVLHREAPHAFAIVDPLRICLTNWEGGSSSIEVPWHPLMPARGSRLMPVSPFLYIERHMFRSEYDPRFGGLTPGGRLVRLLHLGYIQAQAACYDQDHRVLCVNCTFFPVPPPRMKIKGVLHWVAEPLPGQLPRCAEFRLFDNLFSVPQPNAYSISELPHLINPSALTIRPTIYIEPACVEHLQLGDPIQFCCHGYFCLDPDSCISENRFIFNRIAPLGVRESKRRIRKY